MTDQTQSILCGIDVSKGSLDIAISTGASLCVSNTMEGISQWLGSLPDEAHLAVEATGSYHELLVSQALAGGHQVYLINGRQLNHYREAVGPRAKTDRCDAQLLLRYLMREEQELKPVKALTVLEKRLWQLLQRRATLIKVRTQMKLSLKDDGDLRQIQQELTESVNRAIARLEELMRQLVRRLGWEGAIRRCQSIPGVGLLNALALVCCFHRGEFRRSDQWVAYLGLDVRVRDSGASRGRRRLSKRGNPEIRRLLYNGAMSAIKMPGVKGQYEGYRQRGLSSTAALVVLSRKLARIVFAVLSKDEDYDESMSNWVCVNP